MIGTNGKPRPRRSPVRSGALLIALFAGGCTEPPQTFAGTWKAGCADYWGLQIQAVGSRSYSVTFCGLSGCLGREQWTTDTSIENDPMYQVISPTEIRIQRKDGGYFTYVRCSSGLEWTDRGAAE